MADLMQSLGQIGVSEEQVDLLEVATNFCREKSPVDKVRALAEDAWDSIRISGNK